MCEVKNCGLRQTLTITKPTKKTKTATPIIAPPIAPTRVPVLLDPSGWAVEVLEAATCGVEVTVRVEDGGVTGVLAAKGVVE